MKPKNSKEPEDNDIAELVCPVCKGVFKAPVYLPCIFYHSVCKKCCPKIYDPIERNIVCPRCKDCIPLEDISTLKANRGYDTILGNSEKTEIGENFSSLKLPCGVKRKSWCKSDDSLGKGSTHLVRYKGESNTWGSSSFGLSVDLFREIRSKKLNKFSKFLRKRKSHLPIECGACKMPIDPKSRTKTLGSKKFHLECVNCSICVRKLELKNDFIIEGNKFLCKPCLKETNIFCNNKV
eukprot:TRINITY_DN7765_c0_g1_i1.p1 TRINITY_DN7765_c0_g1~~TRINITY_DN7765_c0_g1_i1.p1  ORF type:complete len:237 (+),score=8.01 TRINITY_DN7765_c0_g1_i1:39-749(+)